MLDALRTIEGGGDRLTLRRATPRSRDHLLLEYRDGRGLPVGAQWLGDSEKIQRVIDETERVCGVVPTFVPTAAGQGVIVHFGGCDRRLPALSALLRQPDATLLAHRPERRAVVRLTIDGQTRFVKMLRLGRLEDALARHALVSGVADDGFRVPRVIEVDEDAGTIVFEALAGTSPYENGGWSAAGWRAVGRALRALHASAIAPPAAHDARRECDILTDRLDLAAVFTPDIGERMRAILPRVLDALASGDSPACAIHRDFYDKQVLIDEGGRVGLLDFDTLAMGEPALDLANAIVHIELRMLQGDLSSKDADACARALIEGYEPDGTVVSRLGAYADATRARLVMLYAYRPGASAVCGPMLDRISEPAPACASRVRLRPGSRRLRARVAPVPGCPTLCIVGCPRSGTTMLERMVDAHPRIACAHETHWITRYAKKKHGLSRRGLVTDDLLDALYADRRFVRMGVPRPDLETLVREGIDYAAFVSHVFDRYRRLRGKDLAADKSTGGHVRDLVRLHAICPQTRIVHLIRDGRAVCLSMCSWKKAPRAAGRQDLWKVSPVGTTALWWRWHIRTMREQGRALPNGIYHELRYESLVADPEGQCARLCDLLGIERSDRMARFHVGRENPNGHSANSAWQAPTPGLRDWRTQMPADDLELFEALAGDTLEDLGYERRYARIGVAVRRRADDLRRAWDERHTPRPAIHVRPAALQEKTP